MTPRICGLEIHGMMLHRAGRVVAEGWRWPYRADRPRVMHSATKSVLACAIGIALDEGQLRLEDKVVSFFPEYLPAVMDDRLASMTIEHLLTMRAGHAAIIGADRQGSQVYLPIVQRHFPRAFERKLPADEATLVDAGLRSRLAAGALAPAPVSYPSTKPAQIRGSTYRVEPNTVGVTAVRFEFGSRDCIFKLADAAAEYSVTCGLADWVEAQTDIPGRDLHHGYALQPARVVAGARWLDENTLEMTWIFVETAFRDTVVCALTRIE